MGVDNIHYTASTLGLSSSKTSSINDLDKAAATFCGRSWSDIRAKELRHDRGDPAKAYHTRVSVDQLGFLSSRGQLRGMVLCAGFRVGVLLDGLLSQDFCIEAP